MYGAASDCDSVGVESVSPVPKVPSLKAAVFDEPSTFVGEPHGGGKKENTIGAGDRAIADCAAAGTGHVVGAAEGGTGALARRPDR